MTDTLIGQLENLTSPHNDSYVLKSDVVRIAKEWFRQNETPGNVNVQPGYEVPEPPDTLIQKIKALPTFGVFEQGGNMIDTVSRESVMELIRPSEMMGNLTMEEAKLNNDNVLDACPFCGNLSPLAHKSNHGEYHVHCSKCQTSGPWGYTKDAAVAAWNKRHSETLGDCLDCEGHGWYADVQQTSSGEVHQVQRQCEACNATGQLPLPMRESGCVWQPIATAPKDGTKIMAIVSGYMHLTNIPYLPSIVSWIEYRGKARWSVDAEEFMSTEDFEEYLSSTRYEPTHWMPLPNPPEIEGGS